MIVQNPREGYQADILNSDGTDGKEQFDQDGSRRLKLRQEPKQLHSPDKSDEETQSKSKRRQWQKKG